MTKRTKPTINIGQQARISRINALIRRILAQPKVGYVAYTATPSPISINPSNYEDL